MDEPPYQNREIREMFTDVEKALQRIETQTTMTNGKVAELQKWRYVTMGGLGVLTTIVVPILVWALSILVNINHMVHQSVDEALSAYDIQK